MRSVQDSVKTADVGRFQTEVFEAVLFWRKYEGRPRIFPLVFDAQTASKQRDAG